MLLDKDIKLIAFDLDGTLVDSVPDLAHALSLALEELTLEKCDEQQVRHWIGNGARALVKRALSGEQGVMQSDLYDKVYPLFLTYYAQHLSEKSTVYPHVVETLRLLQQSGYILACITNKPAQFTQRLLDAMGLGDFFVSTISGDSLAQRKPHPEPLLTIAREHNIKPEACLMVGDSRNDIDAAHAACFHSVCVDYGYHGDADVHQLGASVVISCFSELNVLALKAA